MNNIISSRKNLSASKSPKKYLNQIQLEPSVQIQIIKLV